MLNSIYIMGTPVYNLCFQFIIFSFLGWLMETVIRTVVEKQFVNRGFLNGPYCPIYGFGMSLIIIFLSQYVYNTVMLFLLGMLLTTVLEFVVGFALEEVFDAKWWDYSHKKFNVKGYVSADISICWGALCVVMMKFVVPFFNRIIGLIPVIFGEIIIAIYFVVLLSDTVVTVYSLLNFNKLLANLSQFKDEFKTQLIHSELYLKTGAIRDRYEGALEEIKERVDLPELPELNLEFLSGKWKAWMEEHEGERKDEEKYKEYIDRAEEILYKYKEMLSRPNFVHKRIIKAYPGLNPHKNKHSFEELKEKLQELKESSKGRIDNNE